MNININNISKKYHQKIVLNNINMKIENNVYGLIGPNGSGKTTLIRIIVKLIESTSGNVEYIENNTSINFKDLVVGYLPQEFNVFSDFTVYEHLEYFYILKKIKNSDMLSEIYSVLKMTNLYDEKDKKGKNLSGGMIRRLGIAQSLLGNPNFIILDEPTVGLDPYERIRFKEIISKINKQIPIIISTHIIEDISSLCSQVIILKNGKIVFNDEISNFVLPNNIHVYICSSNDLKMIQEDYIKVKLEDGYRIISKVKLNYLFLTEINPELDDAYLFICENY